MTKKIPITPKGYKKLQEELKQLVSVERGKVVQEIEIARAHGDLKENAEYHAAKEKQGHVEGRTQYLNGVLATSIVIDVSKTESSKILFGATVGYEDTETGNETKYQIVGKDEANINEGTISIQSPIAKALLGKKVGDIVSIRVPKGDVEIEVLSIEYK
ncbi:MAG: transcription elongation factor GreA [bacterium]|jgi:transcription elongation factor GreA